MSHIYIYSPSGAVRDKAAFKRGVIRLQTLGHEVEVDTDALSSYQRFAGDDDTRLAAIHRAAASGANIAMISRGGYGLTRLLPSINYKAVAKSVEKGTHFIGFSDFTAFQMALFTKTGTVTWAGPAICDDFGVGLKSKEADGHGDIAATLPDEIMEACFDDLLCDQGEGTGWRINKDNSNKDASLMRDFHIKDAVLWGGNLTMFTALLGTPYMPAVKGGVLFFEDVGEHPYRIERTLIQLLHTGVLAQQKAIVLGQFGNYKLVPHDRGYKLQTVIDWLRSRLKIPVLTNLPFGHVPTKVCLPFGRKVDLVVQGRDALIVWG
jgi:muramoyltetrapeptide carboxypeptidase